MRQLLKCNYSMISLWISAFLCASPLASAEGVGLQQIATDFTGVAKKAVPAVVSINVKKAASKSSLGNNSEFDASSEGFSEHFWERFFGIPDGELAPQQQREGQASGFIVSADGYVITNGHVVGETDGIEVHLHDGRHFPAKVIGLDSNTDIALIKIDASNLPHLQLGNSDDLQVGQWVVAIGTPLGLEASLSAGVVSAKGRNNLDLARVEDYIQTDAALYHGNSGGPLLNLASEVIGINTAIASRMGGYIGIGFAIPSNIAKNVMDQLISKGSVSRGFIGVFLQDINQDQAVSLGLSKLEGALVARVSQGSPADKAGIRQGDLILSYNHNSVSNASAFRTAIAMMPSGSQLKLSLIRNKQPKDVVLEVGEYGMAQPAGASLD